MKPYGVSRLELFPDGADGEHWRLIDFAKGDHFVVGSNREEETSR